MVEQRTLTPLVLVRIQVPQPTWTKACIFLQAFVFIKFFEFERSIFRIRRKTVFFARKTLIFRRFADFYRFTVLRCMRAAFRCASSRRIVAERVNEAGEERGRRSETVLRGDFCAVKRIAAERGAGGGQERVRT